MTVGAAPGAGRKILVIEDDLDLLSPLSEILQDAGYGVLSAADGAEAMRYLREDGPDLVLLDLGLPKMDGWDFARFKGGDPNTASVPIVILSGADDLERHAREIGAAAWLRKPVDVDRLLSTVRRYLGVDQPQLSSPSTSSDPNRPVATAAEQ